MPSLLEQVWTDVQPYLPSIVDAIGTGVGTAVENKGTTEAAETYSEGLQKGADILKGGYDAKLAEIEQGLADLGTISQQGYQKQNLGLTRASDTYGSDVLNAARNYGYSLDPVYDEYGSRMYDVGDQYSENIFDTAAATGQLLDETGQQYEDWMQPYLQSGGEALNELRRTAVSDPSQMTPSQKLALDDLTRNSLATLAKSGLRGAGRAGVAAVNDARARMMAQFYDDNQKRKDAATSTLNSQGYGSTGAVAGNYNNMGTAKANINYQTGNTAASRLYDVGSNVASKFLDKGKDVATKIYEAKGNVAANAFNTGKLLNNLTGQYYSGIGDITAQRTNARANTQLNKAQADASAVSNSAAQLASAQNKNAATTGSAIGQVATAINQAAKTAFPDYVSQNKTSNTSDQDLEEFTYSDMDY